MPTEFSLKYRQYKQAVTGNERSNHTFTKRRDTIMALGKGLSGDILDIGCGYGFRTVGLSEKVRGNVVGVDLDPERIREANLYARENRLDNCRFEVMDAESLDFGDNRFDVVVADEMIHHVGNLDRVVNEMHRVLKKGGIALISDHNRLSLASELVRWIKFGKNREKLFSVREVKSRFQQCGFTDIVYRHILFTPPFYNLPTPLLHLSYRIEAVMEQTPGLERQCGVYVIRGIK